MQVAICADCFKDCGTPKPGELTPARLASIIELSRRGLWVCPHRIWECGMIEGKTQDQMRDEVFKEACREMLTDRIQ